MFSLKTIQQALCLAKLQEVASKAKRLKSSTKPPLLVTPSSVKTFSGTSSTFHKSFNHIVKKMNNNKTIAVNKPPLPTKRRTLIPAVLSEKRDKNLCFWCDEKYTPGHKCKGNKPQFFHFEVEHEEEILVEEEVHLDEQMVGENQCAKISLEPLRVLPTSKS